MSKNLIGMIARELGVEIGEEFYIINNPYIYRFTDKQLEFKCDKEWIDSNYLTELIYGKMEIIKIPKFPEDATNYYFINRIGGVVNGSFWKHNVEDVMRFKLGNYYLTKEEAEEADRQKWIDFFSSAERIEWEV